MPPILDHDWECLRPLGSINESALFQSAPSKLSAKQMDRGLATRERGRWTYGCLLSSTLDPWFSDARSLSEESTVFGQR